MTVQAVGNCPFSRCAQGRSTALICAGTVWSLHWMQDGKENFIHVITETAWKWVKLFHKWHPNSVPYNSLCYSLCSWISECDRLTEGSKISNKVTPAFRFSCVVWLFSSELPWWYIGFRDDHSRKKKLPIASATNTATDSFPSGNVLHVLTSFGHVAYALLYLHYSVCFCFALGHDV